MKVLIVVAIVAIFLFAQSYCPADRAQFCDRPVAGQTAQDYDRDLMSAP